MPRLSQQQTEYSRTLTAMRKERKQFDELEQAFLVYKQSRLNALYPPKSSSPEQQPETIVRMMSMSNIPQTSIQPIQRFLSEQPPTTMTLISSSNIDEQDDSVNDDQTSLSPSTSNDLQKQTTFTQQENQSINSTLPSIQSSSSPSSSFLTPIQPSTSSNNDPSIEHHQMTSSPNHENETIPFEPCQTSPNQDESIPASLIESNIQANIVDQLEQ